MATDFEVQNDHSSMVHGRDGLTHPHLARPSIDNSRMMSDSEFQHQREGDAYKEQIFHPIPEIEKRAGDINGEYHHLVVKRDFRVGKITREGKPFFWVRYDRPTRLNNDHEWVASFCDQRGNDIFTVRNGGVYIQCDGREWEFCDIIRQLLANNSIT